MPLTLISPDVRPSVESLSPVALASVLDQSVDCVKLIGLGGEVQYMNGNGLCAMEVDDFQLVAGKRWADLWPEDARATIDAALRDSAGGRPSRFRAFCPTAKGTPRWWDVTVSSVTDAGGAHAGFLSISRDVTESKHAADALEIAAAEMKHRLKNTYAMISSLLMNFARGNPMREAYAHEMSERLAALSTAQALFVSHDAPGNIGTLIPALLAPFDNPACPVAVSTSATLQVDQGQADAIALVVGELAVNSSKHGAIAHGGSIGVESESEAGLLKIRWVERTARPASETPRGSGQGIRLMERIMRARRGSVELAWRSDGLDATLTLPLG